MLRLYDNVSDGIGRVRPQENGKARPECWRAFDLEKAAMTIEDVLDDRQAQPSAAQLARPRRIDPVKPLGQPGQMLARDSLTMVTHRY